MKHAIIALEAERGRLADSLREAGVGADLASVREQLLREIEEVDAALKVLRAWSVGRPAPAGGSILRRSPPS